MFIETFLEDVGIAEGCHAYASCVGASFRLQIIAAHCELVVMPLHLCIRKQNHPDRWRRHLVGHIGKAGKNSTKVRQYYLMLAAKQDHLPGNEIGQAHRAMALHVSNVDCVCSRLRRPQHECDGYRSKAA